MSKSIPGALPTIALPKQKSVPHGMSLAAKPLRVPHPTAPGRDQFGRIMDLKQTGIKPIKPPAPIKLKTTVVRPVAKVPPVASAVRYAPPAQSKPPIINTIPPVKPTFYGVS